MCKVDEIHFDRHFHMKIRVLLQYDSFILHVHVYNILGMTDNIIQYTKDIWHVIFQFN